MTSLPEQGGAFASTGRAILIGTGLALIGAMLYGANIPAARAASKAGMPGADLIFYRAIILLPLLALAARLAGHGLRLLPGERGLVLRIAFSASLTATFYLSALDHLSVPMTVVIFYTFPLIVMIASNRIEGRRLNGRQIVVFLVAFSGLVLAVGPSLDQIAPLGALFAGLAALACAVLFILAGRVDGPPTRTLFWTQLIMAPVSLAFAVLNGGPVALATFAAAPIAIAIAMIGYAVAFLLQLVAAQKISSSRISLLFLLEPVTAIVLATLFLGETLVPLQIIGVGLIIAALAGEIITSAHDIRDAP